jgi:hypothetical protein
LQVDVTHVTLHATWNKVDGANFYELRNLISAVPAQPFKPNQALDSAGCVEMGL